MKVSEHNIIEQQIVFVYKGVICILCLATAKKKALANVCIMHHVIFEVFVQSQKF